MAEIRIGAWQFDVARGQTAENARSAEAGVKRAAEAGLALVCLPEMWPTSFVDPGADDARWLRETGEALEAVRVLSGELGIIVCGSAYGAGEPGERLRNRLHVIDDGRDVLAYDKVHLFSPTAEHESFSAGAEPPRTVPTSIGRVSGVVCYDLRFGPLLRAPLLDGAELLVAPAQWPDTRAANWRALVLGRAAELQCFVLAANRTGTDLVGRRELELSFPGNSLVAGPDGTARAEGVGEGGLVTAAIDLEEVSALRRQVPVRKDERRESYAAWEEARREV